MRILALDLARLTGWSVGSHESGIEGFGTHEFPKVARDNLGEYGMAARVTFRRMLAEVAPDEVIFEAPILRRGDTPDKLRKIYGLPWELEIECFRAGIKVGEAEIGKVRHHFLMRVVPRTSEECKIAVKVMARRRGWEVRDDNEADSLAVLDHQLAISSPKWAATQTVLAINAGPSDRMSSSGPGVFVGSRKFFPPAIETRPGSENGSAGQSSASSTGPRSPSETMAIIPPSSAGTGSTSSGSRATPTWRR